MPKRVKGPNGGARPGAGRPPHVPDPASRQIVQALAGYGIRQNDIAKRFQIAERTLQKHYVLELAVGDALAKGRLGEALYQMAVGAPARYDEAGNQIQAERLPNSTLLIFLGKTRLGLKEHTVIESPADGGRDLEHGTAGLTEVERVVRIGALLERARARKKAKAKPKAKPEK